MADTSPVTGTAGRGVVAAVSLLAAFASVLAEPRIEPAAADPAPAATAVDPTFGGGVVTASLSAQRDVGAAVAVQPDGSVVVAGEANWGVESSSSDLFVRRYTPAGALDGGFGVAGTTLLDSGEDDGGRALAVQPDGTIVVAGSYRGDAAVVRLHPDGRLDAGFQGGVVLLPAGDVASAVVLDADGRIVTGTSDRVTRLTADGARDATFGDGGSAALPGVGGPTSIALDGDGRIVAARWLAHPVHSGGPGEYASVTRLTGEGRPDESFGQGGTVTTSFDTDLVDRGFRVAGVVVQPDGRIVLAGTTFIFGNYAGPPAPGGQMPIPPIRHAGHSQVALVRYLPDGTIDRSLAGSGQVRTDIAGQADPDRRHPYAMLAAEGDSVGSAVTLDGQGRILVAGMSDQPVERPVVVRYTPAGLLDTTFGRGGALVVDGGRARAAAEAVALASDGRIVVAGRTWDDPPSPVGVDLIVARVDPGASDGTVWTWGWNAVGQLGDGSTTDRRTPVKVPGLYGAVAVSAGGYHTLALRGDGTVWAWGWNVVGQLGDGTTTDRPAPVKVPGLSGIVALSAGGLHSLALGGDGTVWAWGWNALGQLGDGTVANRLRPVAVGGLHGITAVSAGLYHSLAVREEGSPWSWGWNAVGQLGDGTTFDRHGPVQAPRFAGLGYDYAAVATSAGGLHSLGLDASATPSARGWNGVRQLDVEQARTLAVSAGAYHTLTLGAEGTVRSVGWNAAGQLGDGSTATSGRGPMPTAIAVPPASAVAAGGYHSLALTRDRHVWAWGWNAVGQLGTGTALDGLRPAPVPALENVTAVSAGAGHSAAIRA